AAVWLFAERLIFLPPPAGYARSAEVLMLPRAEGGAVAAVHLPNPSARYTVLFSHGNAEDISHGRAHLERLRKTGFGVLAYDYSGYGASEGRPSERAAYADAEAAYEYLTRTLGVPPERIILHGRSLGGGVAAELAARHPVAGLVLESTFTSVFKVVRSYPLVPFDRFRTLDKLDRIACPVLVIHGTDDEVIGLWHGQRLYERVRTPKRALWVRGAGHNDLEDVAGPRYWDTLRDWAASLPAPPSAAPPR
ncbi:MAG TPA: alpha/beta hydrolase, partial [Longimicrobium sp.]|nr:alpha/beta hydrolase [Longimicrobium sp.]